MENILSLKQLLIITIMIYSAQFSFASTEEICKVKMNSQMNEEDIIASCSVRTASAFAPSKKLIEDTKETLAYHYDLCKANNADCTKYFLVSIDKDKKKTVTQVDLTKNAEIFVQLDKILNDQLTKYYDGCRLAMVTPDFQKCFKHYAEYELIYNLPQVLLSYTFPSLVGATHVDFGDIINGKPLGGDGAVLINFREGLIGADNGDIAKFIRDPINMTINLAQEIQNTKSELLNQLCGDVCERLNVKF